MAKIVPFRGVRYSAAQVGDLNAVMAPPYDVISPSLQDDLYQRHPANVVRLILGKNTPDDDDTDNRYTRAAGDFTRMQEQGVLARDDEASIYLYDQQFPVDGQPVTRQGFIALTRIEDFTSGMIKPHEKTLAGPKADRLLLTKACGANFSPIFSLYSDPCCVLESLARREKERVPDVEVRDEDGVLHRLWRVSDPAIIARAQSLLDDKPLFIADGHHRYETAVNYRDWMRQQAGEYSGRELFNYVLMYFANMEDQGMQIFPTHRLIHNLPALDLPTLLKQLEGHFAVETLTIDPAAVTDRQRVRERLAELGQGAHALGLYAGGDQVQLLTLRDEGVMESFFSADDPKALRTLDVSILHRLVLENLLGISLEAQEKQTNLQYVKNFDEPFTRVLAGECQLAFLMNPTRMSEVRDVANAGAKMPQKSTYFYPKLLTGLVINKIAPDETVSG